MEVKKIRSRGQEEIVGFVLIMVIVAIVFLVFLGITIRKGGVETKDSRDVYQFLESAMEYTSDCATRFVPDYSRVGELIEECYNNERCLDGRNACEAANSTIYGMIKSSWDVSNESNVKGFEFLAIYSASDSEENILEIKEGLCDSRVKGATYLIPSFPGTIEASFVICQN